MLSFLPAGFVGVIAGLLFFINIFIMGSLVILIGLIKYLVPVKSGKNFLTNIQHWITNYWTDINTWLLKLSGRTKWIVQGEGNLHVNHWYFVIANHQTWTDIVILQMLFNRKIPLLKFFLKQELLWTLPMGGLACWMLDFPFMKRYSKAYLKKHPEKRTADLDATKKACMTFKLSPTTVVNFLEGTRFTQEKQRDRSSPYQHLLRPKAGGLAFVINELKDYIREVVDVTIVYLHPEPTFWNAISGKIPKIIVNYKVIPLQPKYYGDYYNDPQFRKSFQSWVNSLWQQKDGLIESTFNQENKL